jgi:CubicO group peptidase (beta-lactamase class C family)
VLLRVTLGGGRSYDLALGESMTGVPATSSMHIRAGAFAFTYTSTLLMVLVDKGRVSLDDPLSRWYPDLPGAASITLRNLANMTSGYADYVFQPEVFAGIYRDPFRQWTNADLVRVGVTGPVMFEPGTNWGYSHTSYVILGDVLSQVAKMPLADALQRCEFKPMGLKDTTHSATPDIPEPVRDVFTSERRHALDIAPSIPFYGHPPRLGGACAHGELPQ